MGNVGTITPFISNLLTEVTDTDEMYKMLNEFNNEIIELKSYYLTGQDEEIDDVTDNASIVYNNQIIFSFFAKYLEKDKPRLTQETIAERVKLRRQKADDKDLSDIPQLGGDEKEVKKGAGLKILTPNKLLT